MSTVIRLPFQDGLWRILEVRVLKNSRRRLMHVERCGDDKEEHRIIDGDYKTIVIGGWASLLEHHPWRALFQFGTYQQMLDALTEPLVPYVNSRYKCHACGNTSGEADPDTSFCWHCGADDWELVDD